MIHEIFGLSDRVRGVVDQLAEAAYIAIAPDLLSDSNDANRKAREAAWKRANAILQGL